MNWKNIGLFGYVIAALWFVVFLISGPVSWWRAGLILTAMLSVPFVLSEARKKESK